MQRYLELNKVTHDQIRHRILTNGLSILSENRGQETSEMRLQLECNRDNLKLDGIPEKLLFEDWILIVAQRS